MAENDIMLLTKFGVRGSQNIPEKDKKSKQKIRHGAEFECDIDNDYIHVIYYRKAIPDAIRSIVLEKQGVEHGQQNAFLDAAVDSRIETEIAQKRRLYGLDTHDQLRAQ